MALFALLYDWFDVTSNYYVDLIYIMEGVITEKKEIVCDEKTIKTLYKKALGFKVNEKVEEFSLDKDGKMILSKKKVSQKYIPPDTGALKALVDLIGGDNDDLRKMSDEQLKEEKDRLLKELKNNSK